MQTPCQVEVTPHNPEGIEPFSMVNSPPCQVQAMSLHPINTLSGQVGVIPHNSEGIEPFTMVNSLPCQVRVIPHKSESIEPFNMVNSPPCQVEAVSSHLINTLSGPLGVVSSTFSQGSVSDSPCVAPVMPLCQGLSPGTPHCHPPPFY